jgi:hypothetical protein
MVPPSGLPEFSLVRLGDCWIDGCMHDAYTRVALREPTTGRTVTGLLCDEHKAELCGDDGA